MDTRRKDASEDLLSVDLSGGAALGCLRTRIVWACALNPYPQPDGTPSDADSDVHTNAHPQSHTDSSSHGAWVDGSGG